MFFWTRSFLCIGTVVLLAEGGPWVAKTAHDTAAAAALSGSAAIERACRADPTRCLAAAGAVAPVALQALKTRAIRDAALRLDQRRATAPSSRATVPFEFARVLPYMKQ